MSDALWAARQGDALSHTSVMADILGGVLEVAAYVAIGALATAAVAAAAGLTLATGGIGACVLGAVVGLVVGVAMSASGLDTGLGSLCEGIGNALFPPSPAATILTGSHNTFINGLPAARAAGSVPDEGPTDAFDNDESEPEFHDIPREIFSQMWCPTIATPVPGATPKPHDEVLCTRHSPMPVPLLAEGSAKVFINGQPAVRSGDRSSCGATVVSSGLISPNVRIGGETVVVREIRSGKTPGVGFAVTALAMLRGGPRKLISNLPCMALGAVNGFVSSRAVSALTQAVTGSPHPVHAATGAKVLCDAEELDFVLPGVLPVAWQRFYNSRDERPEGLFGAGWSVPFEISVRIEAHPDGGERLIYLDEQARSIDLGELAPGNAAYSAGEGLALRRHDDGRLLIESEDGLYRLFEPHPADPQRLRLVQLEDRNDNRLLLDYDDLGRLIHVRDTFNIMRVLLVYSVQWPRRVCQIERFHLDESREVLARYDYDAQGDLAEVRDALGHTQRRFVYSERRMVEHQMPSGLRCFYAWALIDEREWRVVKHWTDEGDEYRFDYDLTAGTTSVTDGLGRISTRRWNAQHQITEFTDALGLTWQFEWNDERQLLGAVDPQGGQWQFSYDAAGNLCSTQDPLGRRDASVYLEHWSLPLAQTDTAGNSWRYRYDKRGNCTHVTDPLGHVTRYRHDVYGQVVEIIDVTQKTKKLRWNEHGQVTRQTDCSGYPTDFTYDRRGHLQAVTNALGERTVYQHDACGHLQKRELSDGRVEHFQRDGSGALTRFIDAAGSATHYQHGLRGQVVLRVDAHQRQVAFGYDAYGRLQTLTNENGEHYRFGWDAGDQLLSQRDLDGSGRRYGYDGLGNVSHVEHVPAPSLEGDQTDAAEALIHRFERDALGRVIAKITDDGCSEYRYDDADQLTAVVFTDSAGGSSALGFAYDTSGQLLSEQSASGSLEHHYDELGICRQSRMPDGRWINRLHYGSGHLHQLNIDGQVVCDFERDRLHREVLRSQGQIVTRSQYDLGGRLSSRQRRSIDQPFHLPAHAQSEYRYDPIDNLIGRLDRATHQRQVLHYDSTQRIMAANDSGVGSPETFAYDAAANLLDGPKSRLGQVSHNRLLSFQDKRYRYDGFGRLIEKNSLRHGRQTFAYDAEHRLIEVRNALGNVVRMTYDPLGRRISKTEHDRSGTELGKTSFAWDGLRLLQEHRYGHSSLYLYIDNSHEPLARVDGTGEHQTIRYYHNDLNGLPQLLTETNGEAVWSAEFQVWGNTREENREPYYIEQQNLRFQGQYLDRETGLHYNTFRFYDPDIGRFTTPDPIGLAGGLNLYQYAPNPVGWIDPLGFVCTKKFNKRFGIAQPWVSKLTGKKPEDVEAMLLSKGYYKNITELETKKTSHTEYIRTTKNGALVTLDFHPGGGIHKTSYWKVKRDGDVQGRITPPGFVRYERIVDSPVFVGGEPKNQPR
ncbi:RHS repeat-associated core domain-containing protein [Pseudomonas huanghezhanensis]|uniref:RHS repeat-associated core domain-containing protein n=1 Tax=Pseudomonas huanghezhanensis TaxID=3002903 RepID=UPI002285F6EA|nr:RHS repeat-associated core domain-containing protein [Pseudomonas sp. BSw22131]